MLGFSNVKANGTTYRVFSVQTNTQTLQVAQDMAVRRNMAGNLALRTVGPIAVLMPILMLVVWWVVSRSQLRSYSPLITLGNSRIFSTCCFSRAFCGLL